MLNFIQSVTPVAEQVNNLQIVRASSHKVKVVELQLDWFWYGYIVHIVEWVYFVPIC